LSIHKTCPPAWLLPRPSEQLFPYDRVLQKHGDPAAWLWWLHGSADTPRHGPWQLQILGEWFCRENWA